MRASLMSPLGRFLPNFRNPADLTLRCRVFSGGAAIVFHAGNSARAGRACNG